ncbi:MAG: glycosyltransferase [Planctomycetia bacterium]|nr:glycosyltransferase [Planctomycetia bacterium]MBL6914146.1 glycosyltransferase [Planctomycetota bacterium]
MPARPSSEWKIRVVIPALNEEAAIGQVIDQLPKEWVDSIHVGDNGSTDRTAEVAQSLGAKVIHAPKRGYGSACLAALDDVLQTCGPTNKEIIVFIDGDASDDPCQLPRLVMPLINDEADIVLANRAHSEIDPGSLTLQQRFGNALATTLIYWIHGVQYKDLGPFRACTLDIFQSLEMQDPDFGWTVEMQLKSARRGLRHLEIDLPYRKRIGRSKISGTITGSIKAGLKILRLIMRDLLTGSRNGRIQRAHLKSGRS